jgi:hypothetical protein
MARHRLPYKLHNTPLKWKLRYYYRQLRVLIIVTKTLFKK